MWIMNDATLSCSLVPPSPSHRVGWVAPQDHALPASLRSPAHSLWCPLGQGLHRSHRLQQSTSSWQPVLELLPLSRCLDYILSLKKQDRQKSIQTGQCETFKSLSSGQWIELFLQVITISSSQSASPVTSTVPSATSTLQPLVKLESSSGSALTAPRPLQKYIVVSLPSSASSSLENKSSVLPTSISSTSLESGMKLDRSESPGASTQSPHWDLDRPNFFFCFTLLVQLNTHGLFGLNFKGG